MNHSTPASIREISIAIDAAGTRREIDAMGEIEVPADRYWGAQTQRSLVHFSIGEDRMPKGLYHAYGYVKKAAACQCSAGRLPQWKADVIENAADEAIGGKLDEHFPLYVWQTGSGTQSNMNVNEVSATAPFSFSAADRQQEPIHPNDDVNMGQSSNDTFPTAMHIAAVLEFATQCCPADGLGRGDRDHRRRMERRGQDRPHASGGCGTADRRPGVVGLGPVRAARQPDGFRAAAGRAGDELGAALGRPSRRPAGAGGPSGCST